MWTLRRFSDQDAFRSADDDDVILEWLTIAAAVIALIGVGTVCFCPLFYGADTTPRTMSAAAQPYPFLRSFQPVDRREDAGRFATRLALRGGFMLVGDARKYPSGKIRQ